MSRSASRPPLAIDLYCGLGGWSEALLAEGYHVVGFDIEQHVYDEDRYPGQLVIQDVCTLHGSQFRDAALIVASPPCTEYSYMAMPWSRAKQIARALRGEDEFPEGYKGSRTVAELTRLFDACFRIQREASAAAGRRIPLVVENVKGAQPWVGRAAWNFGSFYLWGDVPALMPVPIDARKLGAGAGWYPPDDPRHQPGLDFTRLAGLKQNPDGTAHPRGSWFKVADSKNRGARSTKNDGGSWFNIVHDTSSGVGRNPVHEGQKVGDRNAHRATRGALHSARFTNPAEAHTRADGVKHGGEWFHDPASPGRQGGLTGRKQPGIAGVRANGKGDRWFQDGAARHGSKSSARKAASARIAKIPFALAQHIARCYRPQEAA